MNLMITSSDGRRALPYQRRRTYAASFSFEYSAGLRKSQIKWTEETLDKWLTDPEKLVPDNDMPFHVENADERREIIVYLKQSSRK